MADLSNIVLGNVEEIEFGQIKQGEIPLEIDNDAEVFEVEFDEDEYKKGIKLGSMLAGMISPILAIGIPHELAIELIANERTIAYNKEVIKMKLVEDTINEEVGIE